MKNLLNMKSVGLALAAFSFTILAFLLLTMNPKKSAKMDGLVVVDMQGNAYMLDHSFGDSFRVLAIDTNISVNLKIKP